MGVRKTARKHRFGRAFRLSRHQQHAIHDAHHGNSQGYRAYHLLFTELLMLRATLQLGERSRPMTGIQPTAVAAGPSLERLLRPITGHSGRIRSLCTGCRYGS